MRSFAGARRLLLALAPPPRKESIAAAEAAGRVLLSDVVARLDDFAGLRSAMSEGRRA